jgi:hypothetical protein
MAITRELQELLIDLTNRAIIGEELPRPVVPTILLFIGTNAGKIAREYKKRARMACGGKLPEPIQILVMDTRPLINEEGEERLDQHEYISLIKIDLGKVIENVNRHPEIKERWKFRREDIPLGLIETGAKQHPIIGLLAFLRRFLTFRNKLNKKLKHLRIIPGREELEERGDRVLPWIVVYIIVSLGGGTGSGILLDAALFLRHKLGREAKIIGILLMPSCFEMKRNSELQKRRGDVIAFTTLRRIHYLQNGNFFTVKYPGEERFSETRPFDYIYIVERTNEEGETLKDLEDVNKMVAHFIFLASMTNLAPKIWERKVDFTTQGQIEGRSCFLYSGFAVSSIAMPEEKLCQHWQLSYTEELAKSILGGDIKDKRRAKNLWNRIVQELKALMEEELRPEQKIYEFLGEIRPRCARAIRKEFLEVLKANGLKAGKLFLSSLERFLRKTAEISLDDLNRKIDEKKEEINRPTSVGRLRFLHPHIGKEILRQEGEKLERLKQDVSELEKKRAMYKLAIELANAMFEEVGKLRRTANDLADRIQAVIKWAKEEREQLNSRHTHNPGLFYALETNAEFDGYAEAFWIRKYETFRVKEHIRESRQKLVDNIFDKPEDVGKILLKESKSVVLKLLPGQFDIRDVIIATKDEVRSRVRQLFDRCKPFWRPDFDIANYSEENIEHIKLVAIPSGMREDGEVVSLFRDYEDFEWVETGDRSRIDVCWIAHGLPISLIKSLDEFHEHYKDFYKTVCLDPDWEDKLPDIRLQEEEKPSKGLKKERIV